MSKILYFLGGVAAGSVATYFALKGHMERRIDEEIESVRDSYKNAKMQQKASEGLSEANLEGHSERYPWGSGERPEEENDETVEKARKIAAENAKKKADLITASNIASGYGYSEKNVDTHATAYNLFSKPPRPEDIQNGMDDNETDLKIEVEDPDIVDTTPDRNGKIYSISPEQFTNEEPYYDKITLEYYTDGILCEALSEEIITDIPSAIGKDALNKFGEYEEDVVYVRNDKRGIDYEVIQQHRPLMSGEGFEDYN